MILKTFRKLVNCIWKQHDWWKLLHCYFWRAVFGSLLSPERSTEIEAIWYISYTEAILYPYSCSWGIITNIVVDADLCMDISEYWIHSECCHLIYFIAPHVIKTLLCLKNLRSVFVMLYSLWKHFEKGNLNLLSSYAFKKY